MEYCSYEGCFKRYLVGAVGVFYVGAVGDAPILAVSALRCGRKRLLLASGKHSPTMTFHRIVCKFTNNK